MASAKNKTNYSSPKKKTITGCGVYTKKSASGGETFYDGVRAGSPPTKAHRRKKPYKGQGR